MNKQQRQFLEGFKSSGKDGMGNIRVETKIGRMNRFGKK